MKVTIDWLKQYVDFDYSLEELVDKLAMLGLEVDSIEYQNWKFDGLVVGQVVKKQHLKEAEHLWLCEVDIGKRKLSIVCGAPNVDVGQKVPVALDGTSLPGGKVIHTTKIRGVESQGMICSEAELGLSSRSEGIMVLDQNVEVGKKLAEVLGEGEVVLDIDVTPNRPDCLGVIGIAREIAALTGSTLKKPSMDIKETGQPIENYIHIEVLEPQACPRYTARFISGITIQPSPWWLVKKLEAVGIRSINNVVDVTNYVMMETGQPLHAFDYDLLEDHKIIVKHARVGETFTTLDDKTHVLHENSLMICDGKKPVAIGGVMGGLNSEVSENTKNVLLECAYFNPVSIRKTSKRLGIFTESSRRFERGTDPNEGLLLALHRATRLIADLAQGEVAKGFVDVYPKRIEPAKVKLRPQRVTHVLGAEIPKEEIKKVLTRLELQVQSDGEDLEVEIPTFRPDLTREIDLIEEIARVHGYDNIPSDTQAFFEQLEPKLLDEIFSRNVRNALIAFGFSQVVTYSMLSRKKAELFIEKERLVPLRNPLSEDLAILRPSLIPGLLGVIQYNINRKIKDLKIFEIGNIFYKSKPQKARIDESTQVAGAITGARLEESWSYKPEQVDFYDLKGIVEHLFIHNSIQNWYFRPAQKSIMTGKALDIYLGDRLVGFLGEINDVILEVFDIDQPVFVFEINLMEMQQQVKWDKVYQPIPRFPAIERDLAVVVKKNIQADEITNHIQENGGPYLQRVKLFDVYTGQQIAPDEKSLAFNLVFYSMERTLKDEEVDVQIEHILQALGDKFAARLRD